MKLAIALLALSTAAAYASELPDAPFSSSTIEPVMLAVSSAAKPHPHHDYMGWSLLASDGGLRLADAIGTNRALRCTCNHEDVLPDAIAHHPAAMYAYSGAVVGMDWYLARELKRHGHSKLARLPYIVDIGVELPTLSNFALPTHSTTMRRMP